MASWTVVAEGVSLDDLEQTVVDFKLPKGTKVRVAMDTWASWAFNVAGAELLFKPFMPEGMELIDVYGEGGQGIVEMEVKGTWFLGILAFIKIHWLAITIAGLVLTFIISFITVMVKLPAVAAIPIALIVGVAIGVVGLIAVSTYRGKSMKGGEV